MTPPPAIVTITVLAMMVLPPTGLADAATGTGPIPGEPYGRFSEPVPNHPFRPVLPMLPARFDQRFLAASHNTNRLDYTEAKAAGLVQNRDTFDAMDLQHRGVITLEDAFRYERRVREVACEKTHCARF